MRDWDLVLVKLHFKVHRGLVAKSAVEPHPVVNWEKILNPS